MNKKVRLDLGSIAVASFETAARVPAGGGADFLVTRATVNICCVDTVCQTLSECSSERCTG